jgi:ferritin-like metal-binding protein YciE
MANEKLFQQMLIQFIQDAYAMENEIAQTLHRQVDGMGDHPHIRAMLVQHLAETELQRKRMAQRLEAYGEMPSAVKGAPSEVLGNITDPAGALRPEWLSRTLRDDYVTEHLEIASYSLLIAAARAYGDDETVRVAELSLKEEIGMASRISARLEAACFMDLQKQGVAVSERFIKAAMAAPSLRVTFEPLKDVQYARSIHHRDKY